MSGLLAGKVWLSDLSAHLKPLAATLADIANDDGTSIYPTIAYVAWRLGAGERTVTRNIGELLEMGVLVKASEPCHHRPAEYQLIERALPKRSAWSGEKGSGKRGAKMAPHPYVQGCQSGTPDPERGVPPETGRGATDDNQGCHLEQSGVPFEAEIDPASLNDPLLDPSGDPSKKRESATNALPASEGLDAARLSSPDALVVLWNEQREPGPKVQDLTLKRRRRYQQAIVARPLRAEWIHAIRWLNDQAYANAKGTGEHPTWRATLDWLAKPGQLAAVLEQAETDAIAPVRRPLRPGDIPSDAVSVEERDRRIAQAREREAADTRLLDEAADLVLALSPAARAQLEDAVLLELEDWRGRISTALFDEMVCTALPNQLIRLAHGRPLTAVVAELEQKAAAA